MLEILLVDDDEVVRDEVASALQDAGHSVTVAKDGEEALGFTAGRTFDVALCDLEMPRIDGRTLLRRLRRDCPATAVVIMTSFASVPDVIDTLKEGAVDFVTKPFDTDELAARVLAPLEEQRAARRHVTGR